MSTATRQRRTPLGLFPDRPLLRLYDRIVEVLRVRHYSRRTEEAYIHWIRRFIEFHQHRHPRGLAEGKGDKDRVTTMPRAVIRPLQAHLQRVQAIHQQDLADGYGRVELPHALARKYPNASRECVGSSCSRRRIAGSIRAPASRDGTTSTNRSCRRPSRGPCEAPD